MAKPEIMAGLDMGSGRVTCVIGSPDPEGRGMHVMGGATVACRGLKGGVVVNINETARAVRLAVEKAEEDAKQMVHGLHLGIRGSHLQSFNNHGAYNIARTDKEITADDVRAVIETAKAIPMSSDREILHVIPQSFSLDRQKGVPDPVGMEGSLLEVDVHIVTASSSHLNNLTKAVAEAGFEVVETVYSLLALGEFLVTPEERDLGSLLVDVGGQSISIGIYAEGAVKFSKELAIGSDFITRDIAVGLRTNTPTAERIKLEYGVAHSKHMNGDVEIEFKGVDGRTAHRVKNSTLMNIILPRVEEMFTYVGEEVQNSNFADLVVPGGAIVSGGGAMLKGMTDAVEAVLSMPARLGLAHPDSVTASEALMGSVYSTALGLVCYPHAGLQDSMSLSRRPEMRWVKRARGFIKDIF
ncbi:MAG: cell division protein FtsA [Elusimicrobiota bacterium]